MGATTQVAGLQVAGIGCYVDAFRGLEGRSAQQPEWLGSLRREAFARFCETGFPTTRDEDWRFTSVASIARESFSSASGGKFHLTLDELELFQIPGSACRLVFVNGVYAPQLSKEVKPSMAIEVCSLAEVLSRNPELVEPHLGHYLNTQRDSFCGLNTALFEDGAYIHIAKGAVIESPLHLLYISTDAGGPLMTHPRNLVVVGENAQVGIVEEHVSLNEGVFFSNVVTELVANENSVVSHLVIERESRAAFHVSTLRIQQARNSSVKSHSVLVGGALVRNNIHPVLSGEGAECLINGLFIGDARQHLDNYMLLEHKSPRCNSRQFFNGILDGEAHGVFHGRIIVHKDAQKTDAKQTNRNLLLSDSAQIDTKPQLEIYADDVKCTHGATIGQVDEVALFYLRSRGLDESSARKLLLFAFAGECLERIPTGAARTYVERVIHQSLPAGIRLATVGGVETERHWEEVG